MRMFAFAIVAILIGCPEPAAANDLAPTGTLRALSRHQPGPGDARSLDGRNPRAGL